MGFQHPDQLETTLATLLGSIIMDKPVFPSASIIHHEETTVKLTVKKLEAGTNKPIPGVTIKIESADGTSDFSVTREAGVDTPLR